MRAIVLASICGLLTVPLISAKSLPVAAEPKVDKERYIRRLPTSEEILNLPNMSDEEDEKTAGMTIEKKNPCDQIECDWPLCPDGALPETKPGDCCPSCPEKKNPCDHIECDWPLCPDGAVPETRPGDCCPSCPEIPVSPPPPVSPVFPVSPVPPKVESEWDAFKSDWNHVKKSAEQLRHEQDAQKLSVEQLQFSLENADKMVMRLLPIAKLVELIKQSGIFDSSCESKKGENPETATERGKNGPDSDSDYDSDFYGASGEHLRPDIIEGEKEGKQDEKPTTTTPTTTAATTKTSNYEKAELKEKEFEELSDTEKLANKLEKLIAKLVKSVDQLKVVEKEKEMGEKGKPEEGETEDKENSEEGKEKLNSKNPDEYKKEKENGEGKKSEEEDEKEVAVAKWAWPYRF